MHNEASSKHANSTNGNDVAKTAEEGMMIVVTLQCAKNNTLTALPL